MLKSDSIKKIFRNRFSLLLSSAVCFVIASFIADKGDIGFNSTTENFEKVLQAKEDHAKEELTALSAKSKQWSYEQIFSEKTSYYESLFEREGLVFLIFENDSLRFWTDNTATVNDRLSRNNF